MQLTENSGENKINAVGKTQKYPYSELEICSRNTD